MSIVLVVTRQLNKEARPVPHTVISISNWSDMHPEQKRHVKIRILSDCRREMQAKLVEFGQPECKWYVDECELDGRNIAVIAHSKYEDGDEGEGA